MTIMFDHVFLNVSNRRKSTRFYQRALKVLGVKLQLDDGNYTAFGTSDHYLFWLHQEGKRNATRKMHLAFTAKTRKAVDRFFEAALKNGGKSNGEPGPRPEHGETAYAAFVLDPDGNNIEAVCYKKEEK
jgi:catechol 2,3-dioxygenase-like lactoylglutathione lyase family enzyme